MVQLDQVIQQNAAASEESSSMAEELSSQAEKLLDKIRFFKVQETLITEKSRDDVSVSIPKQDHFKLQQIEHSRITDNSTSSADEEFVEF